MKLAPAWTKPQGRRVRLAPGRTRLHAPQLTLPPSQGRPDASRIRLPPRRLSLAAAWLRLEREPARVASAAGNPGILRGPGMTTGERRCGPALPTPHDGWYENRGTRFRRAGGNPFWLRRPRNCSARREPFFSTLLVSCPSAGFTNSFAAPETDRPRGISWEAPRCRRSSAPESPRCGEQPCHDLKSLRRRHRLFNERRCWSTSRTAG